MPYTKMLPSRLGGSASQTIFALLLLCGSSSTAYAQQNSDTSDADPSTGNEGPEAGSINLSRGALIAIGIAVGAAVILGTTTAVLFYLAKKRSWEVRKTLRRTALRVAEVMTPRTPKKMTFSPAVGKPDKRRFPEEDDDEYPMTSKYRRDHGAGGGGGGDLEKGTRAKVVPISDNKLEGSVRGEKKQRPRPSNIKVPTSEFEMDSPKTPMVARIFGRK